jgi:hypothetical protein
MAVNAPESRIAAEVAVSDINFMRKLHKEAMLRTAHSRMRSRRRAKWASYHQNVLGTFRQSCAVERRRSSIRPSFVRLRRRSGCTRASQRCSRDLIDPVIPYRVCVDEVHSVEDDGTNDRDD